MSHIVTVQQARDTLDIDFSLCLIRQKKGCFKHPTKRCLFRITGNTQAIFITKKRLWRPSKLCLLFDKEDPNSILEGDPVYHKSSYSSLVNDSKLKNARKRFLTSSEIGEVFPKKIGSLYSAVSSATNDHTQTTRSSVLQFDSESCIFCQLKNKEELHSVSTVEVGKKLLMF
eukprot:gene2150-2447_t